MGILSAIHEEKMNSGLNDLLNEANETAQREATAREAAIEAIARLDAYLETVASRIGEPARVISQAPVLPRLFHLSDLTVIIRPFKDFGDFIAATRARDDPFDTLKLELIGVASSGTKLEFHVVGALNWIQRENLVREARAADERLNLDGDDQVFRALLEAHLAEYDREQCGRPILVVSDRIKRLADSKAGDFFTVNGDASILGDQRNAIQLCRLNRDHTGECSQLPPS